MLTHSKSLRLIIYFIIQFKSQTQPDYRCYATKIDGEQ